MPCNNPHIGERQNLIKPLVFGYVTLLLMGQMPASYTQDKTDREALALLAKAKQQEQKIASGRLKVQVQWENLSVPNSTEQQKFEQIFLKRGYNTSQATEAVQGMLRALQAQKKLWTDDYTFAFDATKMVYLEKGQQNSQPYREAQTETEHIRADAFFSIEKESSPEPRWEFSSNRRKGLMPIGLHQSLWMGRGWESIAPAGWIAEYHIVEKNEDGMVVLLRSDRSDAGSKISDVKVWMDTKHGYALTRVQYVLRKSGRVHMETIYTYDHREDGTYYPKEAVETHFHEDDAGKWVVERRITSHIEKAEINVPIAQSDLKLDVP